MKWVRAVDCGEVWEEWGGHGEGFIVGDRVIVQDVGSELVGNGSFVRWMGSRAFSDDVSWRAELLIDGNDGPSLHNERCFRHEEKTP